MEPISQELDLEVLDAVRLHDPAHFPVADLIPDMNYVLRVEAEALESGAGSGLDTVLERERTDFRGAKGEDVTGEGEVGNQEFNVCSHHDVLAGMHIVPPRAARHPFWLTFYRARINPVAGETVLRGAQKSAYRVHSSS
ncbi:hypothetical protein BQ8794_220160 [Mesorhizobium prunaredense]|uniref:Uncharacterized protein n=1 Tax=Mesorhizobium prunaredense TaxID=1631249 RepID=A0A1R3VB57_9HYPH|nr:hypothetical protein BQ8794_220160 [Mesorhizobium prunaredense]